MSNKEAINLLWEKRLNSWWRLAAWWNFHFPDMIPESYLADEVRQAAKMADNGPLTQVKGGEIYFEKKSFLVWFIQDFLNGEAPKINDSLLLRELTATYQGLTAEQVQFLLDSHRDLVFCLKNFTERFTAKAGICPRKIHRAGRDQAGPLNPVGIPATDE